MEELYSRGRHLEGVRKFEKCNGFSREIWERDKRRKSITSREEKKKTEGNRGGVESKDRGAQEEWITRKVYGKNFVWVEWQ